MGTTPRWVWEGEGPGEVIKGVLASHTAGRAQPRLCAETSVSLKQAPAPWGGSLRVGRNPECRSWGGVSATGLWLYVTTGHSYGRRGRTDASRASRMVCLFRRQKQPGAGLWGSSLSAFPPLREWSPMSGATGFLLALSLKPRGPRC